MGLFQNFGFNVSVWIEFKTEIPNPLGLRSLILTWHKNPIEFCLKTSYYVERKRGTLIVKFFIFVEPSRQGTILDWGRRFYYRGSPMTEGFPA